MRNNRKLNSGLKAVSVAAGAALATGPAQAAIVYVPIGQTAADNDSFAVDLDGDENPDIEVGVFTSGSSSGGAYVGATNGLVQTSATFGSSSGAAALLSTSDSVTSNFDGAPFAILSYSGSGPIIGNGSAFVGLLFNTTDFGPVHGWLRVTMPEPGVLTAVDAAFETSGEGIHIDPATQAVPEPSTLLLMASGAAGLLALRRRRKPR